MLDLAVQHIQSLQNQVQVGKFNIREFLLISLLFKCSNYMHDSCTVFELKFFSVKHVAINAFCPYLQVTYYCHFQLPSRDSFNFQESSILSFSSDHIQNKQKLKCKVGYLVLHNFVWIFGLVWLEIKMIRSLSNANQYTQPLRLKLAVFTVGHISVRR